MIQQLRQDMATCCLPGTREQNDALYPAIMTGDWEAREKMIHNNMSLVFAKVQAFLRLRPEMGYLYDDLIATGFAALTQAVNTMQNHTSETATDNPTGYLLVTIDNELRRLTSEETLVLIFPDTPSVNQGAVTESELEDYVTEADENAATAVAMAVEDQDIDRPSRERSRSQEEIIPTVPDHVALIELRELIDVCCATEFDRQIVAMRVSGHTQEDIAELLGMNQSDVSSTLTTIYVRLQKRMAE